MADLILVSITFGFIALCVAYIGWCDRIIGPDDFGADTPASSAASSAASSGALDAVGTREAAEVTS